MAYAKTLFSSRHVISEITGQPLEAEHDQIVDTELFDSGVLSLAYYSKDEVLRSRITLRLSACKAIEAFTDSPEAAYFQIRADGAQIPILLTKDECVTFMSVVDNLLGKD